MSEPRSVSVTADGLRYTGLEWGPQDGEPIMALHGWLDNALSFSVVAPQLAGYRLIALDLSGQGFSDHRSPDATYHIWDDIPQLLSVADQLGFGKLAVAGHSRGAAIAVLLASALRERCSHLVLLDGMLPHPLKEENVPSQFEQAQIDHRALSAYRGRIFKGIEEYVAARRRLGFSEQSARLIAPRALVETSDGFRLTHDPRLNHASAIKLTPAM
ncbi:MAG: alpha/beta fold hydrolase, partial [Halieaceae bacterium]